MAGKATYRTMVEVEETAEVVVRQTPGEIEQVSKPIRPLRPVKDPEAEKPTAAILPIYLREMGATPLIDESKEVFLARELQEGRIGLAKIAEVAREMLGRS